MMTESLQQELVAALEAEYAAWATLLTPLTAELLTRPGVEGTWAITGVLAHLTFWLRRLTHTLLREQQGERAERLMQPGEDWAATVARINACTVAESTACAPQSVVAAF
jgi:hypothetical protein